MISGKYNLSKFDFEPMEFHLRLYQATFSLAKHGAKSIDAISIYNLTENKPSIKQLFDQNNLIDFVDTIKQLTNIDNIDLYYQEVRKNSILRKYRDSGFDISRFEGNVESYTIKDVVDYFDGLQIDLENRSVTTSNGTFELPPKEFDLLLYCAKHQGKILTKQQIYEEVWGEEYFYDDSNIMAIISRLRKKLEVNPSSPKYIQTVKGIGYRFNKEV